MKGVHWIDLGQWPPQMVLIADKAAYRRFARKHCAEVHPFPCPGGGVCQILEHSTKGALLIMTIGPIRSPTELAASLAHEATHAMRWVLEYVGEKEPGTETQAYLVEHIVKQGLRALSA